MENSSTEGPQLVEWDDWFTNFDKEGLALVAPARQPGPIDETHHIVKR